MDSGIKRFRDVLNQCNTIPPYQRNYVWKTGQNGDIQIFWDDLILFYNRHNSSDKKISSYLLGPIIIHSDERGRNMIVDGQQRITTAVIFLSAAAQICTELYKDSEGNITCNNAENFRSSEIISCIGHIDDDKNDDELKLIVSPKNYDFFRSYIISPNHKWDDFENSSDAIKNMKSAYDFFYKRLKFYINPNKNSQPKDQFTILKSLVLLLLDYCEVFYVDRKTFTDAYSVFETINARGKTLTQADLFKNYVFAKCNPDGEDHHPIEKQWENIEDTIEAKNISGYLRYFWISDHQIVSEHNVFKTISHELTDREKIREFVSELEKYSKCYAFMLNPINKKSIFNDYRIDVCVSNLKTIGFEIYAPLLFSMVRKGYSTDDIHKVLFQTECFAFRNKIIGGKTGHIWNKIAEASHKLFESNDHELAVIGALDTIDSASADDDVFKIKLADYNFTSNNVPKMVLRRMVDTEEYSARIEMQLEHILPENPDFEKGEWSSFDPSTFKSYVYKIGNMTLLTSGDNIENSNSEYTLKRPIYAQSKLELNQEISKNEKWTSDEIIDRTILLNDVIMKIYPKRKRSKQRISRERKKKNSNVYVGIQKLN